MPYIIACAILIFYIYYLTLRYEKRFVRAYIFLEHYEQRVASGATQEQAIADANQEAFALFGPASNAKADTDAVYKAKAHAALHYGKKQRPIIKKAQSLGFFG